MLCGYLRRRNTSWFVYSLQVYDLASSKMLTKFNFGAPVRSVQFSPDGSKLVIGGKKNAVEVCH